MSMMLYNNMFLRLVSLTLPLFITSALSDLLPSQSQAPKVQVLNGTYYGVYSPEYNQDFFLGIPYAVPPLGDLRFRQAQSLNTTWSDTRNATAYSYECYGYGSDQWVLGNHISEDCLTLNVVRPANVSKNLPVAVWIHGGGYFEGGSSDPRYNLSFIVQQSVDAMMPFIGVSINYRLQAWGFLFGREVMEEGSTNVGIRDQRLALHWVQENIAAFGGDPRKVTIWGESAGGFSVGMQLVAYGGRDDKLFRGAISESGVAARLASIEVTPEAWQPNYDAITAAANCSDANDTLSCLRAIPAETLSSIFNSSVTANATFGPVIDNDFVIDTGTNLTLAGKFVRVPYLLGANHDEGTAFGTRGINTTEQFLASITSTGIDNETATILAAVYPDIPEIGIPPTFYGRPPASLDYGSQFKRAAAYGGDKIMHAPRRLTSQMWAQYNTTSYSYVFDIIPHGYDGTVGATHFQEVAFVFHNIDGVGYDNAVAVPPFENEPESYIQTSTLMCRMWISFIVDGDPNHSGVRSVQWPKYTLDNPRNIVFNANVTGLAYVEPDIYRAEGIAYLSSNVL